MRYILFLVLLIVAVSSCNINKDIMFKTPEDYEFDLLTDTLQTPYVITVNDRLSFRLFTNNGARLIEFMTNADSKIQNTNFSDVTYTIDLNGEVKLPELGNVNLVGMTVVEAQDSLEALYSTLYNDPYVVLEVINKRVVVFPGDGGEARVITLNNRNTTLIEALALSGGLANRGNASKVKLIRKQEEGASEVYHLDLSTIEGLKYGELVVQANDIIYVQPTPDIGKQAMMEFLPYLTVLSTIAIIYGVFGGN